MKLNQILLLVGKIQFERSPEPRGRNFYCIKQHIINILTEAINNLL